MVNYKELGLVNTRDMQRVLLSTLRSLAASILRSFFTSTTVTASSFARAA